MKKMLPSAVTLFFMLSVVGIASAQFWGSPKPAPEWFTKPPAGDRGYEYYGPGKGADEKEAEKNAREFICAAIRSDIASGFFSEEEVNDDTVSKQKRHILTVQSDCSLADAHVVDQQRVDQSWYVLVKYEHLSIGKRCKKWLSPSACSVDKQNRYLQKTPLMKEINYEMGATPAFRLLRDNKVWYLKHSKMEKILPLNDGEFNKLLAPCSSGKMVNISATKEELVEGTAFSLTVNAAQDGYVTVFNVYENGEVFTVEANRKIAANTSLTIPDPSAEDELVGGLLAPGKPSQDLYVAVYTPEKKSFSRIQSLGKQLDKEEEHYKFAELLDYLDEYEFSVALVRTLPKKGR
jgi:hypothetical protein